MSSFDLRNRLNVADVRQDKMEVTIGEWSVRAANEVIAEFIRHLGRADRSTSSFEYRAFNLDNTCNYVGAKRRLNIIKRTPTNTPPLFSGYLQLKKSNHDSDTHRHTYTLKLFLSINPTRFCTYQTKRKRNEDRLSQPILFSKKFINNTEDEFSLDGKDNVAISGIAKSNLSSSRYRGMLQAYIDEIIAYFSDEIETFRHYGFEFRGYLPSFSTQMVENYWDVECENPVFEANRLKDCFTALSNRNGVREYRTTNNGSSLSLICTLRQGRTLKIYAKTNKKLRVEITQKYSKNAALVSCRRYEVRSMEGFLNFLLDSEQVATTKANEYINTLYSHINCPNSLKGKPIDFITMFYKAVGDITLAESLFTELLTNGGFSRSRCEHIPKNIITNLINAGILSYLKKPHSRYVINKRFREVAHLLNTTPQINLQPVANN